MSTKKNLFLRHQAQTTPHAIALEIEKAEGTYLYDKDGKAYLDLIAGVSACTLGHGHPAIVEAVKEQAEKHMHVMVYGEYIQKPQLDFCKLLAEQLPQSLETTYLVNSGTEAIEGAMKLAKRHTGRSEVIAAKGAYHGSTHGSLSIMGNETYKQAYRPLLPDVRFIEYNNTDDLEWITGKTAAVVLETIQGAAGFIVPQNKYLKAVKERCEETGALLILDEIQTGFGRSGKLFAFEHYGIVPDILVIAKGMGGGMPIGAFVSSHAIMQSLTHDPMLGHITTFGGHPVCAAAAKATLQTLINDTIIEQITQKEALFRSLLIHSAILEIRGQGLMLALLMESEALVQEVSRKCMERGLLVFWLLFNGKALRITPPLTISEEEIRKACAILTEVIEDCV